VTFWPKAEERFMVSLSNHEAPHVGRVFMV